MSYLLGYVVILANDLIEGSVEEALQEALPQDTFFGSPAAHLSSLSSLRCLSVPLLNHWS